MSEALNKITQVNPSTGSHESLIDEDEIIDILIQLKTHQVEQITQQQREQASVTKESS